MNENRTPKNQYNSRYLINDFINGEIYSAESIKEAREIIEEFILEDGLYHPDADNFAIYKIEEELKLKSIDHKDNHTEEKWAEITKGEDVDEILTHSFIKVN